MSDAKHLLTDLSPILKLYSDGTVERLMTFPFAPPSPDGDPATGVSSKDVTISPSLSARLYLPHVTAAKLPIMLYYHGGGFCLGSAFHSYLHTYLTVISADTAALIVSVDYRIAPEHPLPAAYEDAWESLNWVCSVKDQWITDRADFTRLFIAGDSAGANIAHHMAIRAGSDPVPIRIRGAILLHPFFLGSIPVKNEAKDNPKMAFLEKAWHLVYPSAAGGIDNPYINPFVEGAPSLSGLGCSKIQICVASKDVLAARALVYAAEVRKSGWEGEVEVVEIEGDDHCFQMHNVESEKAKYLINKMAAFIIQ